MRKAMEDGDQAIVLCQRPKRMWALEKRSPVAGAKKNLNELPALVFAEGEWFHFVASLQSKWPISPMKNALMGQHFHRDGNRRLPLHPMPRRRQLPVPRPK
jgi:hypothetical protein